MRLGLFGGSFDPVHLGHLLVALAAREELALTRLFFIPAAQSPFKPESKPTPANERLRLLRLALAGKSWCAIDEQEIKRGGVSYTIDTVRDYTRRFPAAELFYLVGADQPQQLSKWREAAELARLVEFVVMPRPEPAERRATPGAASLNEGGGLDSPEVLEGSGAGGAGTAAFQQKATGVTFVPPFRLRTLIGFPLGVSSSQIRERVKAGLAIDHLVPGAVAEAIRDNGLYL
jgi:nicotinate-nucleotide adenylyltransferase